MMTVTTRQAAVERPPRTLSLAGLALLLLPACYDFHKTGAENPDPIPFPTVVSVQVEYVQPNGCVATVGNCSDLVVFFGSWMRAGGEIQLTPSPDHHVWTGVVTGVPVNFPPSGSPYAVRIYDPFLQDSSLVRYTGERLRVGGQLLERIDQPGGHDESALVYVDGIGKGHNPY
jgi:hypothetical protein